VPKLARQALLLIGLTLLDLIFSTFILPFLHLLTCVYIVCATLLSARTCSALLFSNFVEEKT
jgi:hypothetical protein